MKELIIPWKKQIIYWVLAVGFCTIFLLMDTSI
jgi:hypothetical protein